MTTRTVRDVDEKTWRKLKTLSSEYDMKMGELIKNMAENYEKKSKTVWHEILEGEKLLSDKEAEELEKEIKRIKKMRWF